MRGDPVVRLLTDGPYAGRHWTVTKSHEARLRGTITEPGQPPRSWSRQPYYGHIERLGRKWRATLPGGYYLGTFPSRKAAAEALIARGVKA